MLRAREQLAAEIANMLQNPILLQGRSQLSEQIIYTAAPSRPWSGALNVAPTATQPEGMDKEDDMPRTVHFAQLLTFVLYLR